VGKERKGERQDAHLKWEEWPMARKSTMCGNRGESSSERDGKNNRRKGRNSRQSLDKHNVRKREKKEGRIEEGIKQGAICDETTQSKWFPLLEGSKWAGPRASSSHGSRRTVVKGKKKKRDQQALHRPTTLGRRVVQRKTILLSGTRLWEEKREIPPAGQRCSHVTRPGRK